MQYPRTLEVDEDSGDAFSPEQPASQESQGSAASPGEVRTMEETSPLPNNLLQVVIITFFDFKDRTFKHNVFFRFHTFVTICRNA